MMIPKDNLVAHMQEQLQRVAMSNISDVKRDYELTLVDRGCYKAYRELLNWIEVNYSSD